MTNRFMPKKPKFGSLSGHPYLMVITQNDFNEWFDADIKPMFENAVETIKCSNGEVIVDRDDAMFLSRYSWNISQGYAVTSFFYNDKRHTMSMHRMIMGMTNCHIDHANSNPLDNRKQNLRLCTRSQNMANTKRKANTGFRGVTLNNANRINPGWKNKYSARITVDQERIHLGMFDTAEEAAKAYDEAAKMKFGIFARLNFPELPPNITPIKEETAEDLLRNLISLLSKWAPLNDKYDEIERAKAFLEKK